MADVTTIPRGNTNGRKSQQIRAFLLSYHNKSTQSCASPRVSEQRRPKAPENRGETKRDQSFAPGRRPDGSLLGKSGVKPSSVTSPCPVSIVISCQPPALGGETTRSLVDLGGDTVTTCEALKGEQLPGNRPASETIRDHSQHSQRFISQSTCWI